MKRQLLLLTILIFLIILNSCSSKQKRLKKTITGGEFKYWLPIQKKQIKGVKWFYYVDVNGNWIRFIRGYDGSFERYDAGDVQFDEHWHLINDSLIYIMGSIFTISKLTSNNFNYNALGYYNELIAAPDSMIPKEFLKYQK